MTAAIHATGGIIGQVHRRRRDGDLERAEALARHADAPAKPSSPAETPTNALCRSSAWAAGHVGSRRFGIHRASVRSGTSARPTDELHGEGEGDALNLASRRGMNKQYGPTSRERGRRKRAALLLPPYRSRRGQRQGPTSGVEIFELLGERRGECSIACRVERTSARSTILPPACSRKAIGPAVGLRRDPPSSVLRRRAAGAT